MTSLCSNPFADWPRPLAFAFSGGSTFASTQIGMLRALQDRGVAPDLIVGSSVGALHGALYAADPERATATMDRVWQSLSRRTIFGRSRSMVEAGIRTQTLSDGEALERLIRFHLRAENFFDLAIPFGVVVTDALTGDPEILDQGELAPAVLASAAVPGLFPPVTIDGTEYIAGAVSACIPIRQAIAFGAASVISLDATHRQTRTSLPRSLSGRLAHTTALVARNQRAHAVDELASRYPIAELPNPAPVSMGAFEFTRSRELAHLAYTETTALLDQWCAATA